eukprot:14395463-Ditylum_brightwellii.AAC.1
MAKKHSYKRIYRNDNTYHYPQIPENLLCEKGKDYFTNLILTGSSEGKAKSPKISLLKEYQTKTLPEVECKVVQQFSEGGTKRDAYTFPMRSKQVSSQQALQFGCQMMKDEELYQTVKKVFDNEKNPL